MGLGLYTVAVVACSPVGIPAVLIDAGVRDLFGARQPEVVHRMELLIWPLMVPRFLWRRLRAVCRASVGAPDDEYQ